MGKVYLFGVVIPLVLAAINVPGVMDGNIFSALSAGFCTGLAAATFIAFIFNP